MTSESELIVDVERHAQRMANALAACTHWHERALAFITKELKEEQVRVEAEYHAAMSDAKASYDRDWSNLMADLAAMPWPGLSALEWTAAAWSDYAPDVSATPPTVTRIGSFTVQGQWNQISMPALVPIIGSQNLLIKAAGGGKERARKVLQSIVLRLLATTAPGKLRMVCIDPVGLGATMAGFIKDLPDILTGGQAWFEGVHIERQLADLEAHMATVKQKYLGVRYQTMEEYNSNAGEVAEPYRLLVISDFPARFSDGAAQRLVSIATNGPATGVYVLAMADIDQKMPYNFNLEDVERTASIMVSGNKKDVWKEPVFDQSDLVLDVSPSADLFEQIVASVGQAALEAGEVQVPFSRYVPPMDLWWKGDSRAGIEVPIGRMGAEGVQGFALNERLASSALTIGRPGSGKSTLLHSLITNLAIHYSPDELELYLLDLKQVEFEDYATHSLPHARVVAIESEREFGLSVLRGLNDELQRRSDLFRDQGYVSLSEYRTKSFEPLPRILLIIDEFQELFNEDDAVAGEAAQILDRLIRMGRAFGINALLASQTLAGAYSLSRATKDQVPVRIALQCADADSRLVLSDDNSAAQLLERPGEAIYNAKNGQIEGNSLFQVFWLTPDERERYVRAIGERADKARYMPPRSQIVFRGNAPADILSNRQFAALLNGHGWPGPQRAYPAWLGEPVEIKQHTAAVFRRQSRSNLLIVGQNQYESASVGMLLTGLASLAAQHEPRAASFVLLNLTDVDAPWHDLPTTFAEALPHSVRVFRRRHVVAAIEELAEEMERRLAANDDLRWPSVYLGVLGLHRARDLRIDEDRRYRIDNDPAMPAELLAKLCREGPDVGIHALIWCDTYASLERTLDRDPERDFDMRVALQMSADESRRLLDTEAASKIGPYRAIYYDEDRTGRLEKFRPYEVPSAELIVRWGKHLGARA